MSEYESNVVEFYLYHKKDFEALYEFLEFQGYNKSESIKLLENYN